MHDDLNYVYRATRVSDRVSIYLIAVRGGYGVRCVYTFEDGTQGRPLDYATPDRAGAERIYKLTRDSFRRCGY